MRPAVFALAVLAGAALFVPGGAQLVRALRRSAPRPELEAYLVRRLAESPGDADLLREIARLRRYAGDGEGERAVRERLHALAPGDLENLEALLAIHLAAGRTAEARALVREMLARAPDRRDLRERAVELAEWTGHPAEAREDALWLLGRGLRNPRLARVFTAAGDIESLTRVLSQPAARARAFVAMGAQAEAIRAYAEHLASDPRDARARRELAQLYRWNGRPLDAAAELEASFSIEPDAEVRRELCDIYRQVHRIDLLLPHLPPGLERADVLLALGRMEEARAFYWKEKRLDRLLALAGGMPFDEEEIAVRERMPMTRENRERLAALYAWKKDFRSALSQYQALGDARAVDMHLALGNLPAAFHAARALGLWRRLGDLYFWTGDLEHAVAAYEMAGEAGIDLAGLYVLVGRRGDAIRLLDRLTAEEPHLRAELYVFAGAGDRALAVVRSIPPADRDADRIAAIARAADPDTAIALYGILIERAADPSPYLFALADLYEQLGRPKEAAAVLRRLLALHPDDPAIVARLGLLLPDRALLERALALGSRDPRVHRALAGIARAERRTADAIRHYREYHRLKDDDPETHFALGELTRDPREFDRAWELLPPGEKRIRARILMHRGRMAEAEALLRAARDVEGLVDLLLLMKRYPEAAALPMTPRQRAILAIGEGRHEDAVRLLKSLDLTDPDIRASLGDSLYALGRWQEAQEYATDELKREIRGTYGPEGSAVGTRRESSREEATGLAARYRLYLLEALGVRLEAEGRTFRGDPAEFPEENTATLEEASAEFIYGRPFGFRLSLGAGGWHSDVADGAKGSAGLEFRRPDGYARASGDFNDPWDDTLGAVLLGGARNRAGGEVSFSLWSRLLFSAGADQFWYRTMEDAQPGVEAETATEVRGRARLEFRLWNGEGGVGRWFYDGALRQDSGIQPHLGLAVRFDGADLDAPEPLLESLRLSPRLEILAAGPTAALTGNGWGLRVEAYAGADPARDLEAGQLWGGTAGAILTLYDRLKLEAAFDYVSEQRIAEGGASWTSALALNFNF